ncbi:MAG: hypothetical protein L7F78_21830 [Syntrophales bacterium LBB04]|nr:hypothetical protein [Syntrophales bacterium LBB04]
MEETLESLEAERKSLYQKMEEIGDFRRGIISANLRKCGRKNCSCAKPGHLGHGPQYLWNTTIKGKSYAKSVRLGPELQKYMQETARYREFLRLCEELVHLNERISDLRPVVEIEDKKEREALKKKLQEIFRKKLKKR